MNQLFDKVLRIGEGKILRQLQADADRVDQFSDDFANMTDEELRGVTAEFRQRLADGTDLDELLPEAFAAVREAATRVLGQRHYQVQLMGGAALHRGNIAEMKTGEGKTLVATLPVYLNALTGKGVHVVTVNDYLAKYHAEWMGRVYRFLGMSVGVILGGMNPEQRRAAYNADITYGTNNEFGFDYLRDNMAVSIDNCVQRGHHYAIVDEVDSILIDEARTPLIISGPTNEEVEWYGEFSKIAKNMSADVHYVVDEKKRTVAVTEEGISFVEKALGIENLYETVNTPMISFMNNSIRAKELYFRDRDYVVLEGEVLIVDEHTGRLLEGRRYNDGLHQSIEAKEGVQIREEYQTLASITLQNYFRLYEKLGGMTGTALTEASEFNKIYGLGVVPIPTNKPVARLDQPDLVYRTEDAKFRAVIDDIAERHAKGQPVLVGTTSVAKSERVSNELRKRNIRHEVLNAKQHEREASIVAVAGHRGAVTVATNMAGRGTDIMLGGNVEFLADAELRRRGLDPLENSEEYEAAWPEVVKAKEEYVKSEHDEVVALGGLAVIGTERHESRRIDNQLRGRSGRQGDPGETRFYLSLEDDLMRLFKSDWVNWILQTMKIPDDVPIEHKRVTGAIASTQTQVEAQNFEARKNVLKYDDVMNRQRSVVYAERRAVLEGRDLEENVRSMITSTITAYVNGAFSQSTTVDSDTLWAAFAALYPVGIDPTTVKENIGREELIELMAADAHSAYDRREKDLGEQVMRELERRVVLSVLDRKWREHLYEMDYLREGIGLRAYSQRDPLVEYQREGYDLFRTMMEAIGQESVGFLFNIDVEAVRPDLEGSPEINAPGLSAAQEPQQLTYSAPSEDGGVEVKAQGDRAPVDEKARARAKEKQRQKSKAQRQSRKRNR